MTPNFSHNLIPNTKTLLDQFEPISCLCYVSTGQIELDYSDSFILLSLHNVQLNDIGSDASLRANTLQMPILYFELG